MHTTMVRFLLRDLRWPCSLRHPPSSLFSFACISIPMLFVHATMQMMTTVSWMMQWCWAALQTLAAHLASDKPVDIYSTGKLGYALHTVVLSAGCLQLLQAGKGRCGTQGAHPCYITLGGINLLTTKTQRKRERGGATISGGAAVALLCGPPAADPSAVGGGGGGVGPTEQAR